MSGALRPDVRPASWQHFDVRQIEDFANAVLGAELDVVQMPGPRICGSLAFAARRGIVFSSGRIDSHIALSGSLSTDAITIGIGLRFGPNSRLWLNPAHEGDIGVVLPGDRHDASLTSGSLYVTAALSKQRLTIESRRYGVTLDRRLILRTGLHPHPMVGASLASLTRQVARLHRSTAGVAISSDVDDVVLRAVIEHCAHDPRVAWSQDRGPIRDSRIRIVRHARDYINQHLAAGLTLDSVARAAGTSCRTLSRAFVEVLNDTPCDYVRRLRLHRIRRDLLSGAMPIARVAATWGMHEPGRMSGWYFEMFGESPSATRLAGVRYRRLRTHVL